MRSIFLIITLFICIHEELQDFKAEILLIDDVCSIETFTVKQSPVKSVATNKNTKNYLFDSQNLKNIDISRMVNWLVLPPSIHFPPLTTSRVMVAAGYVPFLASVSSLFLGEPEAFPTT